MTILLYILFALSILTPVYTYFLYPYILKLFPKKGFREDINYHPSVSVLITDTGDMSLLEKESNVLSSDYDNIAEVVKLKQNPLDCNALHNAKGDIILITNTSSLFLRDTISQLIIPLSDKSVGCVSGMSRREPDENGEFNDGANWKYENKIKRLESKIGTLSGANAAIFAFKKSLLPKSISHKINLDFFIPTTITQSGLNVLFQQESLAYEIDKQTNNTLFIKHVKDGESYYAALAYFWRLLLPIKGSFAFWSHRVLKWLVPFNIIGLFLVSCLLAYNCALYFIIAILQILVYGYLVWYHFVYIAHNKKMRGILGKFTDFLCYFMKLNLSWLMGFIKYTF